MIKIEGLSELNDKLKQIREEISNEATGGALHNSLMYASTPMYQEIKQKAPVSPQTYKRYMSWGQGSETYIIYKDGKAVKRRRKAKRGTGKYDIQAPGLYKKSIKRRKLTKGVSAYLDGVAIAIYVSEGTGKTFGSAYYWFFNEYGTKFQAASPIFRPTFSSGQADAADRFNQQLTKRIDKIMG